MRNGVRPTLPATRPAHWLSEGAALRFFEPEQPGFIRPGALADRAVSKRGHRTEGPATARGPGPATDPLWLLRRGDDYSHPLRPRRLYLL